MNARRIALWEVIASRPGHGPAYGLTFGDEATAEAYAVAMHGAGYDADASPCFETMPTLAEALTDAAAYFGDPALEDRAQEVAT